MSQWGWTPARHLGIWRYGAGWLHPFAAAVPYLTVGLLLLMLHFVGGTLTAGKGVLFDLPDGAFDDGDGTRLIALVMPVQHETRVIFDDARYLLGDASSMRSFSNDLADVAARREDKSLLLLADRRIPTGDLMRAVSAAKRGGVSRVLLAGRQEGAGE